MEVISRTVILLKSEYEIKVEQKSANYKYIKFTTMIRQVFFKITNNIVFNNILVTFRWMDGF